MTPDAVQFVLFAAADALTIPHHVAMLAFVLVCLWALYKWGAPILLVGAFFYLWIGRWDEAVMAFALALFLTLLRCSFQFLDRLTSPCGHNRTA